MIMIVNTFLKHFSHFFFKFFLIFLLFGKFFSTKRKFSKKTGSFLAYTGNSRGNSNFTGYFKNINTGIRPEYRWKPRYVICRVRPCQNQWKKFLPLKRWKLPRPNLRWKLDRYTSLPYFKVLLFQYLIQRQNW
jgi:hypothetical protein